MSFKIEKVNTPRSRGIASKEWESYLQTVQELKIGESFVIAKPMSHHRLALSIAKVWLNGNYSMLKCDGGYRLIRNS